MMTSSKGVERYKIERVRSFFGKRPDTLSRFQNALLFRVPLEDLKKVHLAGMFELGPNYRPYMEQVCYELRAKPRTREESIEFLLEKMGGHRLADFLTLMYGIDEDLHSTFESLVMWGCRGDHPACKTKTMARPETPNQPPAQMISAATVPGAKSGKAGRKLASRCSKFFKKLGDIELGGL